MDEAGGNQVYGRGGVSQPWGEGRTDLCLESGLIFVWSQTLLCLESGL